MRQFVKKLNKEGQCIQYIMSQFPQLSDAKFDVVVRVMTGIFQWGSKFVQPDSECPPGVGGRQSRGGVMISANWLPRGGATSLVRRLISSCWCLAFREVSRRASGGGGTRSGTQSLSESGLRFVKSRVFPPVSLGNGDEALASGGAASGT